MSNVNLENEVDFFIKKYETYIGNIEWHIKTNEPPEEEVKKLNAQISYYDEVLLDLKEIKNSILSSIDAIEFLEWFVENFDYSYTEGGNWEIIGGQLGGKKFMTDELYQLYLSQLKSKP